MPLFCSVELCPNFTASDQIREWGETLANCCSTSGRPFCWSFNTYDFNTTDHIPFSTSSIFQSFTCLEVRRVVPKRSANPCCLCILHQHKLVSQSFLLITLEHLRGKPEFENSSSQMRPSSMALSGVQEYIHTEVTKPAGSTGVL